MNRDQLLTVTRTVLLDASAEEVWQLLTDDAELSQWFAGSVSIDPVPGGVGRFADGDGDGADIRRAVVHRVEPGRSIGFTWWDERHPAEASTVELVLDDAADEGHVQLTITETMAPAAGAIDVRACSWMDAADEWDGRLGMLAGRLAARCSPLAR